MSKENSRSYPLPLLLIFLSITTSLSILFLTRLLIILFRPKPSSLSPTRPPASQAHSTHLLIVLGSGGHTAEMLNMLRRLPLLPVNFTHRTYVVSSGDWFSAVKAKEFEMEILGRHAEPAHVRSDGHWGEALGESYNIVTVRRARCVHQSLLTTPWSASLCLWDCIRVLTGTRCSRGELDTQRAFYEQNPGYPDLILTNGPGTGVCFVLACLILLFCGFGGRSSAGHVQNPLSNKPQWPHSGQMRTIFIESWARVKTLSLSGKILLPFVDRFLVQWPALQGKGGGKAEYVGTLVA